MSCHLEALAYFLPQHNTALSPSHSTSNKLYKLQVMNAAFPPMLDFRELFTVKTVQACDRHHMDRQIGCNSYGSLLEGWPHSTVVFVRKLVPAINDRDL